MLSSRVGTVPLPFPAPAQPQTILLVDGDNELLGLMRATFHLQRLHVMASNCARGALEMVRQRTDQNALPDLALIEIALPDRDGLSLGQELLQQIPDLSLFFLTKCCQVEAKVRAMLIGADDYITKPFEWAELVARVERSLKRRQRSQIMCCHFGGLEIDFARGRVRVDEQEISLSMHEYRFLCCLARSQGHVASYAELAEALWPNGVWGNEEDLVKKVKLRLQSKLDRVAPGVRILHNVPGAGYYLEWKPLIFHEGAAVSQKN
jgi:DNA-binding response OmpR family regulator